MPTNTKDVTFNDFLLESGMTETQIKSSIIMTKVTAVLSFFGSLYVIQDVARNPRKRQNTYCRIIAGMSILDLNYSFWLFLNTWVTPKGDVYYSYGNLTSCYIQGFFSTIGLSGVPIYGCSLALFYKLCIKDGWNERKIKNAEKWLHIVPWCVGLGVAIAALAAKAYMVTLVGCLPFGCGKWDNMECIREEIEAYEAFKIFWIVEMLGSIVFTSYMMFTTFLHMSEIESNASVYSIARYTESTSSNVSSQTKRSILVLRQGVLYATAMFFVFIFSATMLTMGMFGRRSFIIYILNMVFHPLQGLFNALIYLYLDAERGRHNRAQPSQSQTSLWKNTVLDLRSRISSMFSSSISSLSATFSSRRSVNETSSHVPLNLAASTTLNNSSTPIENAIAELQECEVDTGKLILEGTEEEIKDDANVDDVKSKNQSHCKKNSIMRNDVDTKELLQSSENDDEKSFEDP